MGRLFVCDAGCVMPYGHNVSSLRYFAQRFTLSGSSVFALCCRYLPEKLIATNEFEGFFQFYYPGFLELPSTAKAYAPEEPEDVDFTHDHFETTATADAHRLLETWSITSADRIMLPSADFYTIVGLLNALTARPPKDRPALYLRFIGVMENASHAYPLPLEELLDRLREAKTHYATLSFGAETPRYADYLAERLGSYVAVLPYPHAGECLRLPDTPFFTFFCPGAARSDKGYFLLREIFAAVRRRDPNLTIRFVTQILPDSEAAHHETYTSSLYAMPGVTLLPAVISTAEMLQQYEQCHAVLLPYDTATYALRGSAVMMEAAYLGRQILTLDGTGFADQVRYYGLGTVVTQPTDLVDAILTLARVPRATLSARAIQSRHRFCNDANAVYEHWLGIES